jgi:hypothetical protein
MSSNQLPVAVVVMLPTHLDSVCHQLSKGIHGSLARGNIKGLIKLTSKQQELNGQCHVVGCQAVPGHLCSSTGTPRLAGQCACTPCVADLFQAQPHNGIQVT